MSVLRFFAGLLGVFIAALCGNWVGDQLRARATGEKGHQFQFSRPSPENETEDTVISIKPNLTNFGPALLAGVLLKPHLAWAFLGGVLSSGLLGERYEKTALDYIKSKMPAQSESPA